VLFHGRQDTELVLHSLHSLDNGTGQRTQVVFGCLRLIAADEGIAGGYVAFN